MARNRFSDHLLTMPHLLQALRRSIKGEKDNAKISIAPKSAVAIVPPKKVCKLSARSTILPSAGCRAQPNQGATGGESLRRPAC